LFLGTDYDGSFLEDVNHLARDIDSLTGRHAAAILFTPPPPLHELEHRGYAGFTALGRPSQWADWDEFVTTMTEGSYRVSEALGIGARDLPAVVFLVPDAGKPEFAAWKLRDTPLREVYRDLRSILSEWYAENAELIERIEFLRMLAKTKWDGSSGSEKQLVMLQEFVSRNVLPLMLEAAEDHAIPEEVKGKLIARLEKLRRQPRNLSAVSEFLKGHRIVLSLVTGTASAETFAEQYYHTIRFVAQRSYDENLTRLGFPLERVSMPSRKLGIRHFFDRVNLGSIEAEAGGVKFKYDPLTLLRGILGFQKQS